MKTHYPKPAPLSFLRSLLSGLCAIILPLTAEAELSIAYSGSVDQAVVVSFYDRQTVGNSLVGTLQIQNISGTWIYVEQDVNSTVTMPYTVYLLGPDAIKIFTNITFPQGSYLRFDITTPLGLDFANPSVKVTSLQGALAVDLLTRGLLTFNLPWNAFDSPPDAVTGVIEPLLGELISSVHSVGHLLVAVRNKSLTDTLSAISEIASESEQAKAVLSNLLGNKVTKQQVGNALGFIAEFINLPQKVDLITDLTARTFDAPMNTWSRMDVVNRTQTPYLISVTPTTLTTMPVPQTQVLTIHGSGFTSASRLVFTFGTTTFSSRPDRLQYVDANTIRYNIAVGSAVGTWSVRLADGIGSTTFQVQAASTGLYTITPLSGPHGSVTPNALLTKSAGESHTFVATPQDSSYTVDSWYIDNVAVPTTGNQFTLANIQAPHTVYVTFKQIAPITPTGFLTVSLQPASAVAAGAQWRVNAGVWRNSADIATDLVPGTHTISFKTISGYNAPASRTITIVSGSVTSETGFFTAGTPITYTLTLNSGDGVQGYISASPQGNGAPPAYDAATLVQLRAYANVGYHFVGWGGDLSGAANPTTVIMDGNKSVVANFATGDPNMGTVIITIQPPEAAAAGVKWGWNSDDYRDSGSSATGWPGTFMFSIHGVDGWIGPSLKTATIYAGQTTNVTVTFTPDPTPGLLTVTLSPPAAVAAGAKWRVNGGTPQSSGSTVTLPHGNEYSITFDQVPGWTSPFSQSVSVQRSQTTIVNGNYTPPAGQPLIISIRPPSGPLSGGTFLTIDGININTATNVLVGHNPATNITIVSPTRIVCVTPSNGTSGTVPVIVQTTSGFSTNLSGFTYGIDRGSGIDLATTFGGIAYAVAVQGNYAYIGQGSTFLVVDVSNPSSPSTAGRIILPSQVRKIALSGQYAYVAASDAGLLVVDISVPAAPQIRGTFADTPCWTDSVAILGGRAYVADEINGLQILDLGSPTTPVLISSTALDGPAFDVAIRATPNGVFAYSCVGGSLVICDVSNPISPTIRGRLSVGSYLPSISVAGDRVVVADYDNGVKLLNVSNPDIPSVISSSTPMYPYAVFHANGLVYAAGALHNIKIFDITSGDLNLLGEHRMFNDYSEYWGLAIAASNIYVAGSDGLRVFNVSLPNTPQLLTSFSDSGRYDSYASVASLGSLLCATTWNKFKVFDVSNPYQPVLLSQINDIVNGGQVLAKHGYAYITGNGPDSDGNSTKIISLASPESPQVVATIPNTVIYNSRMALSGSSLFVAGSQRSNGNNTPRIAIVDVSIPSSPTVRAAMNINVNGEGWGTSIAVVGGKAALGVTSLNSGIQQNFIQMIDMSNLATPVERARFTISSMPRSLRISPDGNAAYAISSIGSTQALVVVDITNISNPVGITNILLGRLGLSDGLEIIGNELFVATYRNVYAFDISNRFSPSLKRHISILDSQGMSISATEPSLIYVATSRNGVSMLKLKDMDAPEIFITNPVFARIVPVVTNTVGSFSIGGVASDNVGVYRIVWTIDRAGSGDPVGTGDWFASNIPLFPGTNVLTVTAFDVEGNSSSDRLTVVYQAPKINQNVTFPVIADRTFGEMPITLVASASSGLSVSFSVISGPASLSNNVLTLEGAGNITVQANQSGNDFFNAAPTTNVSFNVAKADQAIVFATLPDKLAGDPPFALSATASSGLPVYFDIVSGPAVLDSNVVNLLGGGMVTISTWQPGDSNYNAAATVRRSFNVAKLPQTISFGMLSRQTVGDAPFTLSAIASSGLPVTYKLISGPVHLNGNLLIVTGAGTAVVRASQEGNVTYLPADPVDQTLVIAPGLNIIGNYQQFSDGRYGFRYYGEIGINYIVLASANLTNWLPVFTNKVDESGYMDYVDSSAASIKWRFYRVRR